MTMLSVPIAGAAPRRVMPAAVIAVALWACSGASPQGSEGETHWLSACDIDADCGSDGSCICGTCTVGCAGDATCDDGSLAARCFATASPGLLAACGESAVVPPSAICLADCAADDDCDGAQHCLQGACVAMPVAAPPQNQPAEDELESPDPRDYLGVAVDVSAELEGPPTVPAPSETLVAAQSGFDLASLEGVWRQECPQEFSLDGPPGCLVLTFDRTPDGAGLRGTLELEPIGDLGFSVVRSGPFGQPEAGVPYPPGMSESEHVMLIQYLTTGVPYRVLDLEHADGVVSFWTSPFEVWVDWCPLQTSSLGEVRGVAEYRCIPAGATPESVGPEMFRLCSNDFASFASVCQCGAAGCVANDHVAPWRYQFDLEGDELVGRWLEGEAEDVVLRRVR